MQTNQTPEALAVEIKDAVGEYANLIRIGHVVDAITVRSKLIADTDRLRDMAVSGAKECAALQRDAERLESLRRSLAVIGVVGQIDGQEVVRRSSVLDIADRRIAIASDARKGAGR